MDKLIYEREQLETSDMREMNRIEFNIPSDLNINEFKIICIRMAHSLGYSDKSISDSFGDITDEIHDFDKFILNLYNNG